MQPANGLAALQPANGLAALQPANGLAALQPANGQDLSQQEVSINACRRGLYVESFFIVVWIISGVFEWQSVPVTLLSLLVEESCFLSVSFFFFFPTYCSSILHDLLCFWHCWFSEFLVCF